MPSKAVVMRFSAAFRVALAPDSLTIIPPENHFVNTFFRFFDKFFGTFLGTLYIVVNLSQYHKKWFFPLSNSHRGSFCYYIRYRW